MGEMDDGWPDNIFESCTYCTYTNIIRISNIEYPTILKVVCKRLAVVKDFVIVKKVIFGATHGGGSMEGLCESWQLTEVKC